MKKNAVQWLPVPPGKVSDYEIIPEINPQQAAFLQPFIPDVGLESCNDGTPF